MSVIVKPPKRKLDDLDGPIAHNHRHLSHSPYVSSGSQSVDPAYGDETPRERVHSLPGDNPEASHWFAPSLRGVTSSRGSPTAFEGATQVPRKFARNSSIVLIGIRGTGKSSLAVILAATSGRRLIDADRYFQQVTGRSRAAYKKEFELVEYRQQEARVMESMLAEHQEGCVIACGPGSMERSGQMLLREYARTHPVIYLLRDAESIQSYLKAWNVDKVRRFLGLAGPIYRACSNLEFFNVSEKGMAEHAAAKDGNHAQLELELDQRFQAITPFLTLKRLQLDFLRFIAFATGDANDLSSLNASFPLSMQAIESRAFTYAVTVPISSLLERDLDIEDLESTSDAFELKIDITEPPSSRLAVDSGIADKISHAVANIRRNTVVPLVYHVESSVGFSSQNGEHNEHSRRPTNEYLNLIQHGLRLAPEFVTVDLSYSDDLLSQIIASKGASRVIGHYAAAQPPPRGWDDPTYMNLYERAKRLGCDLVRLTQPATSIEDNFAVQRFRDSFKSLPTPLPLIAYNSGLLGRLSCCFNPILTPVTHQSLLSETQLKGLPCITLREAQEALYSSFTLDPMQFFLFGGNVTYSLSPIMHNAAYNLCGMPHVYRTHQSSTLRGLNDLVSNPHFGGTSVALPYKTEVIPLLHSMSPHARAIGAVNTLVPIREGDEKALDGDGSPLLMGKSRAGPVKALHGDNTDWIGIGNCFRRGLSPANAIRPLSTGLVIGAGGMARAAVYAMIHLGVQNIFVFNRTVANAEKLARHYNQQNLRSPGRAGSTTRPHVHVLQSQQDSWPVNYKQPTVICSCIPTHSIGGEPAPNNEIPSQWLESPTGGVVVELAYKSLNTPLIKQIRALSHRGWVALDGLDVLPEQGFAQFELFTGRRAPRRLMRTVVLKEYKEEEGQYDPQAIQHRLENLKGQPT
ncbi:quinate pathway repressor protein QutR [Aspergillus indologenus CBS 114.80]|uniref:Quinate pathway repressor protein QutR n=1 Tax=Aspergillus indologenus CBS 114.80 TaxID=1450541 RepID=A0A2V5J8Q8_9EURO|nr:quinate pathway repressor protein QutR [Aspergillus indologenus CBS 114.80]